MSADVRARARAVRLVLADVDGTLTDGGVFVGPDGEALVRFSRRDGMGFERLRAAGLGTGLVTRERSPIVERRAEKLAVSEVHLGVRDKLPCVEGICARLGLALAEVAYLGDDINDLAVLGAVGLAGCPADADASVRPIVHHVCTAAGGQGAFREFAELILAARGE